MAEQPAKPSLVGDATHKPSILSTLGNLAGIASLVLAVAQPNLALLQAQQKWGLAVVAAASVWAFLFNSHIRIIRDHTSESDGRRLGFILLGGVISVGLLLAVLPFFRIRARCRFTHNSGGVCSRNLCIRIISLAARRDFFRLRSSTHRQMVMGCPFHDRVATGSISSSFVAAAGALSEAPGFFHLRLAIRVFSVAGCR